MRGGVSRPGAETKPAFAAMGGSLLREVSYHSSRPELKMIGLELISAPDVTECFRLLAAGLGLVPGDEVNG